MLVLPPLLSYVASALPSCLCLDRVTELLVSGSGGTVINNVQGTSSTYSQLLTGSKSAHSSTCGPRFAIMPQCNTRRIAYDHHARTRQSHAADHHFSEMPIFRKFSRFDRQRRTVSIGEVTEYFVTSTIESRITNYRHHFYEPGYSTGLTGTALGGIICHIIHVAVTHAQ